VENPRATEEKLWEMAKEDRPKFKEGRAKIKSMGKI